MIATKFIAFASGFAACEALNCALDGRLLAASGLAAFAVLDAVIALHPKVIPA